MYLYIYILYTHIINIYYKYILINILKMCPINHYELKLYIHDIIYYTYIVYIIYPFLFILISFIALQYIMTRLSNTCYDADADDDDDDDDDGDDDVHTHTRAYAHYLGLKVGCTSWGFLASDQKNISLSKIGSMSATLSTQVGNIRNSPPSFYVYG